MGDNMFNKNKFENGTVKISNEIINKIASTSTLEIEGVAGLAGGLGERITDGIRGASRAVQVNVGRDFVNINVNVILKMGVRIPEVSRNIQEKIKENVENFTGLNVSQVNTSVVGIY